MDEIHILNYSHNKITEILGYEWILLKDCLKGLRMHGDTIF